MPIPLPKLDDRRWPDLIEEGRGQIPRYAPEWTDHNAHDPGITLIDLFAWLTEMTNYRLNRVPDRHRRKFLELLGYTPLGPAPAHACLSLSPAGGTAPFALAAGVEFEGTSPDHQVVPFRSVEAVIVSDTVLRSLRVDTAAGIEDRTRDFADGFPLEFMGRDPQPGSALCLGFDPAPAGVPVALGFRFAGPGNTTQERERIIAEAAAQGEACKPVRPRFTCGPVAPQPPVELPPHHSARIEWEALTASGWVALKPSRDDTRSLTLDGIVEVTLPAAATAQDLEGVGPALIWIRCRLVEGAFDAVPLLLDLAVNAVRVEQAVAATQTFVIRAGVIPAAPPVPGSQTRFTMALDQGGVITALDFSPPDGPLATVWRYVAAGPSTAGELTLGLELAGIGTGLPDQRVTLSSAPIAEGALDVHTLTLGEWRLWTERSDFDASSRTDDDFVPDQATGVITFGSGERGRAPEGGCLIFAAYRSTAAAKGNLGAGLINRARQSPVNAVLAPAIPAEITNRAPAIDGAAAETLNQALGEAVEMLHAHQRLLDLAADSRTTTLDQIERSRVRALAAPRRAVNLLDIERIALSVPGTRVARAHAWASLHPVYACLEAPGVVAVVIVPEAPVERPVPSPGLLAAVWRYLNRRRMVTTMLEVVGPQYVEITVKATFTVRAGASAARVRERILAALHSFLNPLNGGPDALGWPFGRSVFRSEILQLIDSIPGVDHVGELSIQADTGPQQCGDIALCPMALVVSGAHSVEAL